MKKQKAIERIMKINRIYIAINGIMVVSFSSGILTLMTFIASFPTGYIEGSTSYYQTLTAYLNPKLYLTVGLGLIGIGLVTFGIRLLLKKKFNAQLF